MIHAVVEMTAITQTKFKDAAINKILPFTKPPENMELGCQEELTLDYNQISPGTITTMVLFDKGLLPDGNSTPSRSRL
jgi:hypothetical protein